MWPYIGWSVENLQGIDKCQEICYGVDQYIPAPIGAQAKENILNNDVLLQKRSITAADDETTCNLETSESYAFFVRAQQLNESCAHVSHLKSHYEFEDELAM